LLNAPVAKKKKREVRNAWQAIWERGLQEEKAGIDAAFPTASWRVEKAIQISENNCGGEGVK